MKQPTPEEAEKIARRAKLYERTLNRLAKWRTVLTGWCLGTKGKDEPGVKGMRDIHEQRLIMRVEMNAVTALLIEKGVFTADEFKAQIVLECDEHQHVMEAMFPGHVATEGGIAVNTELAAETYKRLSFPP